MMILRALFLIVFLTFTGCAQVKEPPKQAAAIIAGTRIKLQPPADFAASSQFAGYGLQSHASSIMITEMPGPFAEISAGFSSEPELTKRGMALLDKQEIKVGGADGLLVKIRQNAAGTEFLKWILVFGDAKESVVITAAFPQEHETALSERMRASILTAEWDREKSVTPFEGLNFTFGEKGDLKFAKRVGGALLFTESGEFVPSENVDEPLLVVAQSVSEAAADNLEKFAETRILQTSTLTDFKIEQSNKIVIDDLDGYEITAKAKDKKSGRSMVIYQAMLFEGRNYFLVQGLVSDKNRQPYLEIFKEMAKTLERKKTQAK